MNDTEADPICEDSTNKSARKNVRCPTCNGIGWVRKEEEGQLVALIPLNDQRLKPRRTLIYVIIAVCLCLVVGGLCCFFLYPRDVSLSSNKPLLQPLSVVINNTSVEFNVTNHFNLSNANFYPTPVKSISVSAMMDKKELAVAHWRSSNQEYRQVSSRGTISLPINLVFLVLKKDDPFIFDRCKSESPWMHNLYIAFVVSVEYTAMGHTQEVSGNFLQRVVCHDPLLNDFETEINSLGIVD